VQNIKVLCLATGSGPEEQTQTAGLRSFAELEAIVAKGLSTYQEVGGALNEIHCRKLYKAEFTNFKTYLEKRWGISRAHGYRLMAAAKVAQMSPIGDKPANEHQARMRKSKPNKPLSKVVFDLNVEFETFTEMVNRWENALSHSDYRGLLERVDLHVDNLLCVKEEKVRNTLRLNDISLSLF
jgi:hypothetical protein